MAHRWKVLLVTSVAVFMAFLDVTIVNIAFPDIQASFPDTSRAGLSWVLNAYNIVFAALLMAVIYVGGDFALVSAGLPNASVTIFQGLLLVFYLASSILIGYRIVLGGRAGRAPA